MDRQMRLQDCIDDAIADLEERVEYGLLDDPYPEDAIAEIADSHVPIYTYDVLALAQGEPWLALAEPEIPGDGTPINTIQINIYCAIQEALYPRLEELREEAEEEEEEEDVIGIVD